MTRLLKAALMPVTDLAVFIAVVFFAVLLLISRLAGVIGLWLLIIIIPAVFRYQTTLVENVGRNRPVEPFGVEFFQWFGDAWRLFPALVSVVVAWLGAKLYFGVGQTAALAFVTAVGLVYPAMVSVLSITRSPLQSLNPVALMHLVGKVGPLYLVAPACLAGTVYVGMLTTSLPLLLSLAAEMILLFSLHCVIGALIQPHDLFDDVSIPDPIEPDDDARAEATENQRNAVLGHAYGFISRGNRDGGFKHITDAIDAEIDTVGAWAWYFDSMMRWEQKEHALFFAQRYIHDMLRHGEAIPALKVILRCRLVDEHFRPLREDIPAAIEAAQNSGNIELAAVLKRA